MKNIIIYLIIAVCFIPTLLQAVPMSGTYTIGTAGNYTTITVAVSDLTTLGVSGAVVFELNAAYTSGSETFPITIGAISGASATNTITIRPAAGSAGKSISASNATAIFVLDGADYVIFDGRQGGAGSTPDLLVENTNTTGITFQLKNGATYNTIKYLTAKGVGSTNNYPAISFGTSTGPTGNNYNTIDHCSITKGASNLICAIYSFGSAGYENAYNTISNCSIFDFFNYGIYLGSFNTNGWQITGNNFYCTYATISVQGGIYVPTSTVNGLIITNNNIGGSSAGCGGATWSNSNVSNFNPIYITPGSSTASIIKYNTIKNINYTGAGGLTAIYALSGKIYVNENIVGDESNPTSITCTGNVNTTGIYGGDSVCNNIISGFNLTGNGAATIFAGIISSGQVINNNLIHKISVQSTLTGGNPINGGIIATSPTTNSQINNNIIYELFCTAASANLITGIKATMPASGANYISNNQIFAFSVNGVGARLDGITFTAGNSIISNNMINLGTDFAGATINKDILINGIYKSTTGNAEVYFNTVQITGTAPAASANNTIAFWKSANGTADIVKDNIFSNNRYNTTGTAKHYSCYLNSSSALTINYNNYFVEGIGTVLGSVGAVDKTSLALFQASTGQDANSLSLMPVFISTTDIHLQSCKGFSGIPIGGISTDFDFDPRVYNSIGADDIVAPPTADAGVSQSICQGASANLSANGGTSYSWTSGANTQTTSVSPGSTITYTVTVTDGGTGCAATDSLIVTVKSLPVAVAGTDVNYCQGSPTLLNASGGGTYAWSPGAGLSATNVSNPFASPASTTTYTLTVILNGCSATDDIIVTTVAANAGADVPICSGASTMLSALGGGSYNWNGGPPTQTYTVSPAVTTTYTVTINNGGCVASDDVVVTVNARPNPMASSNGPVTVGNTLDLTCSLGGMTSYSWSGPSAFTSSSQNPSRTNVTAPMEGTYIVTVTAANTCSNIATVYITILPTGTYALDIGETMYLDMQGSPRGTIQWQDSLPGGSWNDIGGANSITYSENVTVPRCLGQY